MGRTHLETKDLHNIRVETPVPVAQAQVRPRNNSKGFLILAIFCTACAVAAAALAFFIFVSYIVFPPAGVVFSAVVVSLFAIGGPSTFLAIVASVAYYKYFHPDSLQWLD